MSEGILTQQQQNVLELLKPVVDEYKFYLAGGTALALQIKHRRSIDFDFFSFQSFNPAVLLSRLPPGVVMQEGKGTLTVLLSTVQTSFFEFSYPLLFPLAEEEEVPVAGIADIAAMKVSAIAGRGSRKDFIDLFCITQKYYSLKECLKFFSEKYTTPKTDIYHLLRSLTYFDDAEKEIEPEMVISLQWNEVKSFFVREVKKLQ